MVSEAEGRVEPEWVEGCSESRRNINHIPQKSCIHVPQDYQSMYYLYILRCQRGKLYTGITSDIQRRFKEHRRKKAHFTSYNLPEEVIYTETFPDRKQAAKRERQLKRWTRAKKMALIDRGIVSII